MPVPICLDGRAAHSYFLHIAKWALMAVAGCTKAQMTETITTAIDKRQLPAIESEPVRSRMSKLGYPDDSYEHWLPHLRFLFGNWPSKLRGANLPGSPLPGGNDALEHRAAFGIAVQRWSDGTEYREGSVAHHPYCPDTRRTLEPNFRLPFERTPDP